jgi:Flp pilus assembly protein TadD
MLVMRRPFSNPWFPARRQRHYEVLLLGVLTLLAVRPDVSLKRGYAAARDQSAPPEGPASLENQVAGALAQGAGAQASALLSKLLAEPSVDPNLLLRVGIGFAQRGMYSEAARAFARCVRDHPELFEAHYNLALAELGQNHLTEALSTIDRAPHNSEEASTARLYLRGKIEAGMGNETAAEKDLGSAFERNPKSENYALDLGLLYLRKHDYAQAERVFQRGDESNSRSPYLLLGLALAQFLRGEAQQSVEASRRLLEIEPGFSTARLLLSFTLYFDGDFDGARDALRKGLDVPNPDGYLYYLDAVILLKQHNREYPRILSDLAAAEKSIPDCALCFIASGKAREEQQDLRGALSDYETAVRLVPGLSEGWYHLASACDRLGRKTEAAQARSHFQQMKANDDEREKEMMRAVFLRGLGAEGGNDTQR